MVLCKINTYFLSCNKNEEKRWKDEEFGHWRRRIGTKKMETTTLKINIFATQLFLLFSLDVNNSLILSSSSKETLLLYLKTKCFFTLIQAVVIKRKFNKTKTMTSSNTFVKPVTPSVTFVKIVKTYQKQLSHHEQRKSWTTTTTTTTTTWTRKKSVNKKCSKNLFEKTSQIVVKSEKLRKQTFYFTIKMIDKNTQNDRHQILIKSDKWRSKGSQHSYKKFRTKNSSFLSLAAKNMWFVKNFWFLANWYSEF